jgi:hypothetical protein
MRKKRKQINVIGWELKRQLSEPGGRFSAVPPLIAPPRCASGSIVQARWICCQKEPRSLPVPPIKANMLLVIDVVLNEGLFEVRIRRGQGCGCRDRFPRFAFAYDCPEFMSLCVQCCQAN